MIERSEGGREGVKEREGEKRKKEKWRKIKNV